jgi:hypothetical protein
MGNDGEREVSLEQLAAEAEAAARTRRGLIGAGVGLLVLVIIAVAIARRFHDSGNVVPQREQHTIDSLHDRKPGFDSAAAAGRLQVIHDTVRSVVYRTEVKRVMVAAAADRTIADSLTQLAARATTAADSATQYHAALDVRTREADSLRVAVAFSDSAWQYERDARIGLGILYAADTLRRVALEQLNVRLAHDVVTAGQCRILWVAACPSRKQALIGGTLLGAAAKYAWDHSHRSSP